MKYRFKLNTINTIKKRLSVVLVNVYIKIQIYTYIYIRTCV